MERWIILNVFVTIGDRDNSRLMHMDGPPKAFVTTRYSTSHGDGGLSGMDRPLKEFSLNIVYTGHCTLTPPHSFPLSLLRVSSRPT